MPPRFAWGGAQLWMPRDPTVVDVMRGSFPQYWGVVAHLKPGVSLEEAEAEMNVIAAGVAPEHREDYPTHFHVSLESFVHAVVYPGFRRTLYVLFAAVGLLLLIGCANVANLLLARSTMRGREFAVRAALGASRVRLVRQLLLESLLLALGGAAVGVLFAWFGIRALAVSMPPFTVPSETVIEMNAWVLLFGIGVAVATVVIFGLAPALQASRVDVQEALRDSGKGLAGTGSKSRLRNGVIVFEVALSLILLFTAGLFMRSFMAIQRIQIGWQSDHILTGRIPLPAKRYKSGPQLVGFFQPLLQSLKSIPGVEFASPANSNPPYGGFGGHIEIPGKTHPDVWRSMVQLVGSDYFSVVRQPLVSGRMFTEAEASSARKVAVINQTFQHQFLGSGDPLGQTISLDVLKERLPDAVQDPKFEVIGVAADARNDGLENSIEPEVWIPYSVTGSGMRRLMVRTTGDPHGMNATIRKAVWAVDPGVAFAEGQALDDQLNVFSYAQPRLGFFLVATFAGVGLILVALGVYSVIAYTTSRRTHEIGIRMALGAARGDVLKMVLKYGFTLIVPGIVIGLIVSFVTSRALMSLLWGVSPYDPLATVSVVFLLFSIGLVACWVPARRATRVDPMTALRYE
jgi:putative ABC transport system permease protein